MAARISTLRWTTQRFQRHGCARAFLGEGMQVGRTPRRNEPMACVQSTLIRYLMEGVCRLQEHVPMHQALLTACSESMMVLEDDKTLQLGRGQKPPGVLAERRGRGI